MTWNPVTLGPDWAVDNRFGGPQRANTMLVMEQTTRPFTRPQALRQGLTDGELGGPKVQRIFQGVYVRADVPVDVETRTRAALSDRAGAVQ